MCVPDHFAVDDAAVRELLAHHGSADLLTATPTGLLATTPTATPTPGSAGRCWGTWRATTTSGDG